MVGTLEIVNVLDHSEKIGEMILRSDVMKEYIDARDALDRDETAQSLIKAFNDIKIHYDDLQRFGRYHPDYNEMMRKIRATKRDMDLNEKVARFKVCERKLQSFLDDISEIIARSVSENIKVPRDGAALTDVGCSGSGCGSGGTCSCKAS